VNLPATLPAASLLVACSAAVIFVLGALHLLLTFRGTKLHPRSADLKARLEQEPLVLTRQTTMWKAWLGFNASHSSSALLFGAVYAYLALAHGDVLFGSWFLLSIGLLFLVGYSYLGKAYWFSVPFRGILLALALYVGALVLIVA
jgi:hypothetical protein